MFLTFGFANAHSTSYSTSEYRGSVLKLNGNRNDKNYFIVDFTYTD
jgi:hypothetical protein